MVPAKGKDVVQTGHKRSRSASLAAAAVQRIPLGRGKAPAVQRDAPAVAPTRATIAIKGGQRPAVALRPVQKTVIPEEYPIALAGKKDESDAMDVEELKPSASGPFAAESSTEPFEIHSSQEVQDMIQVDDDDDDDDDWKAEQQKGPRVWPELGTERKQRFQSQVDQIREYFHDEPDEEDPTMVSEYADEIFGYMHDLEVC